MILKLLVPALVLVALIVLLALVATASPLLTAIAGFWVLGALLAMAIGAAKRHAGLGFTLGLLLGPIGVLVIAVLPASEAGLRTCPYCAEKIQPAAIVCKHCGRSVSAGGPVTQGGQA